ncbi:TPA: hypothetical protein ACVU4T_003873 [Vibrio parahaemolyticus]
MNIELLITITTAIVIANAINQAVINPLLHRARPISAASSGGKVKAKPPLLSR